MRRKMIVFGLIALLTLLCPMTGYAQGFQGSRTGSITMSLVEPNEQQPITGAEFDIYHIATVGINTDEKLNYIYTEAFKNCGIDLVDPELAAKLSTYTGENPVAARRMTTDANGEAAIRDLPLGMYLVKQVASVAGFAPCAPFLVTVPMQNDTDFVYDVNASPKTDVVRLVSINIKKAWNSDRTTKIPNSVTVELLQGETVVKTAVLDKTNSWKVTYADMPESDTYSIREINVPKGFAATYSQKGFDFTVTNTASLAQTGQIIWPIPVLAMVGMIFLMVGFVILRRAEKNHA